jgi:hypothetical protein
MRGIQFVTDEKGRKVAVQIDLKKYGAVLEDFWDGLISESRREEKGIPLEKIKADLVKCGRLREQLPRRGKIAQRGRNSKRCRITCWSASSTSSKLWAALHGPRVAKN